MKADASAFGPGGDAVLDARDVTVRLGGRPVVRGVSLAFGGGVLVGILGPNGSGKTTLMRALAGLQALSGGIVSLEGRPLDRWRRPALAARVAYLPQRQSFEWPIRVDRAVALGRIPHTTAWRRPTPEDSRAVDWAMDQVSVRHLADRPCTTLSGGERARVMLARVLAVEAPILLADEPVAALDPRHQIAIMEILRKAAAEGRCVVTVLHDLALAARFCDRIAVMDNGAVTADGPPGGALSAETVRSAFGVTVVEGVHEARRFVLPWSIDRRFDAAPPAIPGPQGD